ncbi:MAG: Rieske 2Fe-2S domain-containing protein [Bacteroidia bacterium]
MKINSNVLETTTAGSNISCLSESVKHLKYKLIDDVYKGGSSKAYSSKKNVSILPGIKKAQDQMIEIQAEKFVPYHNGNDFLHSNTCIHEQCFVKWNNDETSWDCPCHGNRFSSDGKLMNNPANVDLPFYNQSTK